MTARKQWFNMPHNTKKTIDSLITKIEAEDCFSTTALKELKDKLTWWKGDITINDILNELKDVNYPVDTDKARWFKLDQAIDELEKIKDNFSCHNIPLGDGESTINLTQYASDGDLYTANESIDVDVYFEDASGDNVPNVGVILYTQPTQRTAYVDKAGAYYFTKPNDNTEISLEIDASGKVLQTNFAVTDSKEPSAPTNLSSANTTATTTDLTWNASVDDTGVDSYNVYKDGVLEVNVATTSASITGLTASTTYSFTVTALDAAGNESAPSTAHSVTTTA